MSDSQFRRMLRLNISILRDIHALVLDIISLDGKREKHHITHLNGFYKAIRLSVNPSNQIYDLIILKNNLLGYRGFARGLP